MAEIIHKTKSEMLFGDIVSKDHNFITRILMYKLKGETRFQFTISDFFMSEERYLYIRSTNIKEFKAHLKELEETVERLSKELI